MSFELLEKFRSFPTNKNASSLFIDIYDGYLVGISTIGGPKLFKWDNEKTIYMQLNNNDGNCLIQNTLLDHIILKTKSLLKKKGNFEDQKAYIKSVHNLQIVLGDLAFCSKTVKIVAYELNDNEFLETLDSRTDVINFTNGMVNLKTGKFRERTSGDYFSKTLDYPYYPLDEDNKITKLINKNRLIEYVEKMYFDICNNNIEATECMKEYFGYCMTGDVNEEIFLMSTGAVGSNGKTKLAETFAKAMSIYVKKLDNRIFEIGNNKTHKQFTELKNKRMAYVEELNKQKKQNMELIKDITGGNSIGSNEILYGTVEDIKINFKLYMISNNDIKFDNGGGIERRGRLIEHINNFVDKEAYDNQEDKERYFIKDNKLLQKFNKTEYKLALIHVLLPYAMKHYKKNNELFVIGDIVYKQLHNNWKNICGINDIMAGFIDMYYIERDDKDKIIQHKDSKVLKNIFIDDYKKHTGLFKIADNTITTEIKRLGYSYNKDMRCNGGRGAFIGLKRNTTAMKNNNNHNHNRFDDSEDELTKINK